MSHSINRQIFYTGRVQGVGFRYSVKQIAAGFEVVGWVRNLPDGRVEIVASGDGNEVAAFLEAVASSHLAAHIRQIDQVDAGSQVETAGFEIRH